MRSKRKQRVAYAQVSSECAACVNVHVRGMYGGGAPLAAFILNANDNRLQSCHCAPCCCPAPYCTQRAAAPSFLHCAERVVLYVVAVISIVQGAEQRATEPSIAQSAAPLASAISAASVFTPHSPLTLHTPHTMTTCDDTKAFYAAVQEDVMHNLSRYLESRYGHDMETINKKTTALQKV